MEVRLKYIILQSFQRITISLQRYNIVMVSIFQGNILDTPPPPSSWKNKDIIVLIVDKSRKFRLNSDTVIVSLIKLANDSFPLNGETVIVSLLNWGSCSVTTMKQWPFYCLSNITETFFFLFFIIKRNTHPEATAMN